MKVLCEVMKIQFTMLLFYLFNNVTKVTFILCRAKNFAHLTKEFLIFIWEKAAQLVHSKRFKTPIPGDFEGSKGRMVASSSSINPHMVTVGQKNDCLFVCDQHCLRYTAYKFFAHTITVAEVSGCLSDIIKEIKKAKNSNLVKAHLPWI